MNLNESYLRLISAVHSKRSQVPGLYAVAAIARRDPCIDDKEAFPILRVRQECFKAFVILEVGDSQLNAIIIWGRRGG